MSHSSSPASTHSPSPIAIPKGHSKSKSILKHPMRDAASYLTALSQADADARAAASRKNKSTDSNSDAGSIHSFMTSSATIATTTTTTTTSSPTASQQSDNGPLDSSSSEDSDDNDTYTYDELDNSPYTPEEQALRQFTTKHAEFGHCDDQSYRFTSAWKPGPPVGNHIEEDPPYYILLTTYFSYLILIILGHLRDFFGKRFNAYAYKHLMPSNVRLYTLFFLFPKAVSRAVFCCVPTLHSYLYSHCAARFYCGLLSFLKPLPT